MNGNGVGTTLKCFFCGKLMSWLRFVRRTKWRNFDHYELEDANLYWCDQCKVHWWQGAKRE